jgi:sulfopropanediol 3-dehydrogenase
MPRFLKSADRAPVPTDPTVQKVVSEILADVAGRGVEAVRSYSEELDRWSPARFTLTEGEIERASAAVPRELRDHIDRAAEQIRLFAIAQRESLAEVEIEPSPGIVLGHRLVPISSVGAYSPGGRYPLIASSLMTTVVPKVAGVERVVACAPPISPEGIAPAMIYAMRAGGADEILCVGGAHGLASLAYGIEDVAPVDMIVGAGNAYVAEAKRQLFGRVGIDLLAGPTEILIVADGTADPELLATDIAGQLEHGPTSVGWLVSTDLEVAARTLELIERRIDGMPTGRVAREAWEGYGEIVVAEDFAEAVALADERAAEHVEIHTADPAGYLAALRNYGSIFLGENTTVPYGDKGIGTNHVLPTAGAARYTGGLWVGSFLKTLTYQSATDEGSRSTAPMVVAICEAEELPGHARSAQERLDRLSPLAS